MLSLDQSAAWRRRELLALYGKIGVENLWSRFKTCLCESVAEKISIIFVLRCFPKETHHLSLAMSDISATSYSSFLTICCWLSQNQRGSESHHMRVSRPNIAQMRLNWVEFASAISCLANTCDPSVRRRREMRLKTFHLITNQWSPQRLYRFGMGCLNRENRRWTERYNPYGATGRSRALQSGAAGA